MWVGVVGGGGRVQDSYGKVGVGSGQVEVVWMWVWVVGGGAGCVVSPCAPSEMCPQTDSK